jgi:hypothetical protein
METQATQEQPPSGAAAARPGVAVSACLVALLLPGAGHLLLGRLGRGAFFLAALVLLFALGVGMDARLVVHLGLDDPLGLVIGLGQVAIGLPYLLARALGHGAGDATSPVFDYGITFTATGGLLNLLVALDALDVGLGRKP